MLDLFSIAREVFERGLRTTLAQAPGLLVWMLLPLLPACPSGGLRACGAAVEADRPSETLRMS